MEASLRLRGLNAFTLKLIALVSMTLDHIYFYLYRVLPLPFGLRIIGRLAAPIFLHLLCWSFDYTRSRPRFLLRLYLWSAGMELCTAAVNLLLPDPPGYPVENHIFMTMFSIALCLCLLSRAGQAAGEGKQGQAVLWTALLAAVFLLPYLIPSPLPLLLQTAVRAALPLPSFAEGGPFLVLFGIGLYYVKDRPLMLGIYYCLYSVLSIWLNAPMQVYMVFALPLLLSYNRQRGPKIQSFFYLYYPLHAYLLFGLGVLLSRRIG